MTNPQSTEKPVQPNAPRAARGLDQRVLSRLRRLELPNDATIAVGFSGGVDSLCLAATLSRLQKSGRFRVHLVHIDHGLREESKADADRARALADQLGLPITVRSLAPDLPGRATGVGIEGAARRERYAALADIGGAVGAEIIALGHHLRDQAETVLLHLLRGAGLSGAAAMAEVVETALAPGVRLWRPLLNETRDVIEATVLASGLRAVEDPSNNDQSFMRNWLRSQILPAIEARNPGAVGNLARYASIAADDDALLTALANQLLESASSQGRLEWARIKSEPPSMRRRSVRTWLGRLLPDQEISLERVEAVIALADRENEGAIVQVGGHAIAVWSRDGLIAGFEDDVRVTVRSEFNGPLALPGFEPMELQSGVPVEIDGWRLAGWGAGPIELRRVALGDRMAGSGRPIRELARASGVHALIRRHLIVAAQGGAPVWVAGLPPPASDWRFELTRMEGER